MKNIKIQFLIAIVLAIAVGNTVYGTTCDGHQNAKYMLFQVDSAETSTPFKSADNLIINTTAETSGGAIGLSGQGGSYCQNLASGNPDYNYYGKSMKVQTAFTFTDDPTKADIFMSAGFEGGLTEGDVYQLVEPMSNGRSYTLPCKDSNDNWYWKVCLCKCANCAQSC